MVKRINADKKKANVEARSQQQKRGVKEGDWDAVYVPITKAPISELVSARLEIEYQRQPRNEPMIALMEKSLTEVFQQGMVEAIFSKIKRILHDRRLKLKQEYLDMLLTILCNGPESHAGRIAKFTRTELIETAYEIWCNMDVRKIKVPTAAAAVAGAAADEYAFGAGYESHPDFEKVSADDEAERAANHRKRLAAAPQGSTAHTWIKSTERAAGGGAVLVDRAVLPDHNGCTVQPNDEIAVSGFEGVVWYTGRVVAIDLAKKKSPYETYFPADGKSTHLALKPGNYGPAVVTKGLGGNPDHIKGGWYYLVPTVEASGESRPTRAADTA